MGPFFEHPFLCLSAPINSGRTYYYVTTCFYRTISVSLLTLYILCIYPVILDKSFFLTMKNLHGKLGKVGKLFPLFLCFLLILFSLCQRSFLASLSAARWHYSILFVILIIFSLTWPFLQSSPHAETFQIVYAAYRILFSLYFGHHNL